MSCNPYISRDSLTQATRETRVYGEACGPTPLDRALRAVGRCRRRGRCASGSASIWARIKRFVCGTEEQAFSIKFRTVVLTWTTTYTFSDTLEHAAVHFIDRYQENMVKWRMSMVGKSTCNGLKVRSILLGDLPVNWGGFVF